MRRFKERNLQISQLCPFLDEQPQTSSSTFLCLSFLIWKIGVLIISCSLTLFWPSCELTKWNAHSAWNIISQVYLFVLSFFFKDRIHILRMKWWLSSGKPGLGHLPKCLERLWRFILSRFYLRDPNLVDGRQSPGVKAHPPTMPSPATMRGNHLGLLWGSDKDSSF